MKNSQIVFFVSIVVTLWLIYTAYQAKTDGDQDKMSHYALAGIFGMVVVYFSGVAWSEER